MRLGSSFNLQEEQNMEILSTGGAAKRLGVSRDSLLAALRSGAPEPETPRIGGRRIFSEADIERLEAWYAPRRQAREGFHHA